MMCAYYISIFSKQITWVFFLLANLSHSKGATHINYLFVYDQNYENINFFFKCSTLTTSKYEVKGWRRKSKQNEVQNERTASDCKTIFLHVRIEATAVLTQQNLLFYYSARYHFFLFLICAHEQHKSRTETNLV